MVRSRVDGPRAPPDPFEVSSEEGAPHRAEAERMIAEPMQELLRELCRQDHRILEQVSEWSEGKSLWRSLSLFLLDPDAVDLNNVGAAGTAQDWVQIRSRDIPGACTLPCICARVLIASCSSSSQFTSSTRMSQRSDPAPAPPCTLVLHSPLALRLTPLERGNLVTAISPFDPTHQVLKRVIGLPGDTICVDPTGERRNARDEWCTVPKGHVWIAGDNASNSTDSRDYGPVPLALIKGKVVGRVRFPSSPVVGLALTRNSCRQVWPNPGPLTTTFHHVQRS
jgi:inner membrane protease subunit 1